LKKNRKKKNKNKREKREAGALAHLEAPRRRRV